MDNNYGSETELETTTNVLEISACLGFFMGSCEDVLGIGVYNLLGKDLFSSAKDLSGDVGLTAFKSLLEAVGNQIETILPSETSVQFIAPSDILVGVSKISSEQMLAVILKRDAQISSLIPSIIELAKLLRGISNKTKFLSIEKCRETYERTIANKDKSSSRRENLVQNFGA